MKEGEARGRFGAARVARIATVSADGTPHLVPIVFALDGDVLYSAVDAKPKSSPKLRRLRNIEANPRVALLVDEYDEEWQRLWWARADGTAQIVERGPRRERAIELLRTKYPQYADLPDAFGAVIEVDIARWTGWEFGFGKP